MPRLTFKGLSEDLLKDYDITLFKTATAYKVEFPCGKVKTLSTLQSVVEQVSEYQASKIKEEDADEVIDAEDAYWQASTIDTSDEDITEFERELAITNPEYYERYTSYWDNATYTEETVEPLSDAELIDVIHRMAIENQMLDDIEDDQYNTEERAAIQSENEPLVEGAIDWDYELSTAYWQPLPCDLKFNYILEIFLLVFDVKLTAYVIEAYCSELSQEWAENGIVSGVDTCDEIGTKAMHLGNDADDLMAYLLEIEDESFLGYGIYEVINASVKYIHPTLTTLEFLELQAPVELFYWDTEKRTLVEVSYPL